MAYYHAEGLLYTGSYDMTVKAWRVSDNKCVDSFVAHEDHINALVVNQDDGCVFTCSSDGSVRVWRRIYRENPHSLTVTLKFRQVPVNALALSTWFNQCFLYSGSSDGTINFWEKEKLSGRFNHGGFLQGHRFSVLCLASIGRLIFSGSEDTTIRVWRRNEESCLHECLAVLEGHRGPVRCLAACLEMERVVVGFLVFSASLDKTFKVWRVRDPGDEGACLDYTDQSGPVINRRMMMEYDSSPALSPSWVEKKLQGNYYFH
ncbi:protein JINGUBANG-like [Tripterygium wilfordii]|nr:protein JINGUBANG-like [Tripterygium wilfordii]